MGRIVWEQPGGSAGVQNWLAAASGIASGMADSRLRQGAVDLEADRFDRQRTAIREDQNALLDRQVLADQRRMQMQEGIDTRRQERDTANINLRSQLDEQRAAAKRAYEMGLIQNAADEMTKLMGENASPEFQQAVKVFRTTGDDAMLRQAMAQEQKRRANVEAAAPLRALVTREGPPTLQDDALVRGVEAGQFDLNDPAVRGRMGIRTQTETLAGEREARLAAQAAQRQQMKAFMTADEKLLIDQLENRATAAREAYRLAIQSNQFQTDPAFFAPFQKAMADAETALDGAMSQIRQRMSGMVPGQSAGGAVLPPMANPQPPQTLDPAAAQSLGVDAPSASAPLGTVKAGPNKGRPVGPAPGGGFMLPSGRSVPDGFATPPEVKAALQQAIQAGTLQPGSLQLQAEYLRLLDEYMAAREPGLLERVGNSVRGVFGG